MDYCEDKTGSYWQEYKEYLQKKEEKLKSITKFAEERIWITKEGNQIKFEDLSNSHLNNILKMVLANPDKWKPFIDLLKEEKRERDYKKLV